MGQLLIDVDQNTRVSCLVCPREADACRVGSATSSDCKLVAGEVELVSPSQQQARHVCESDDVPERRQSHLRHEVRLPLRAAGNHLEQVQSES